MSETRISGRLPQLDVEIRTGRDEEAGAEWMTVHLRAVPSFEAAARLFDPFAFWRTALAWNPWLAWMRTAGLLPADGGGRRLLPDRQDVPGRTGR